MTQPLKCEHEHSLNQHLHCKNRIQMIVKQHMLLQIAIQSDNATALMKHILNDILYTPTNTQFKVKVTKQQN